MTTSALPHSLAGGLPFRRFDRFNGQKGSQKIFQRKFRVTH
jgi:hypothetical protein